MEDAEAEVEEEVEVVEDNCEEPTKFEPLKATCVAVRYTIKIYKVVTIVTVRIKYELQYHAKANNNHTLYLFSNTTPTSNKVNTSMEVNMSREIKP
jgi:hypothetical protein